MSLILKALQKVERERKKDGPEPPSFGKSPLAGKIVGEIGPPGSVDRRRRWLPLTILVLLVGGAFGVLFMLPSGKPSKSAPAAKQLAAQTPPSVVKKESSGPVPTPEISPEPLTPPAAIVPPVIPAAEEPTPLAAPIPVALPTLELKEPEAPPVEPAPAVAEEPIDAVKPVTKNPVSTPKKKVVAKRPSPKAPTKIAAAATTPRVASIPEGTVPVSRVGSSASGSNALPLDKKTDKEAKFVSAPVVSRSRGWALDAKDLGSVPPLKISEIHYRASAKERLAVVNGLPVLEGVDIEGARVDRIFKDRIRFVINGRYLEVKLDPVTPSQTTSKP